jgi:hypothetical protein|nr:MAG TPA: Protein of unknown function (DUF739) [Caudoviricetes sp.]
MPYKYNKLRGRIVERFGSQEKFAETLKKSNVSVSRKMNGKVGFSQNDMVEWGNLLHIPLEEYGEFFFT